MERKHVSRTNTSHTHHTTERGLRRSQNGRNQRRTLALLTVSILTLAIVGALSSSSDPTMTPDARSSAGNGLPQLKFTKNGELTFISAKNTFIATIDIEVADTPEKRTMGMMYRNSLGENQGMLFVFSQEDYQSFWMKNTAVPLDMIFVNAKNEVVTIHENTTPYSPQSYSSTKPAQFVVEVNAGFVAEHGITVGDRIRWQRR